MKKGIVFLIAAAGAAAVMFAQASDIVIKLMGGERAVIAVPELRGSGAAQNLMGAFNQTLWNDLSDSGIFRMAPRSMYPVNVPQQPKNFSAEKSAPPGLRMADWSGPPVSANYLTFGYTAAQGEQIVLFGYLYNVTLPDPSGAQVIGKLYFGPLNEEGARKVAREFAADILTQFGLKSLLGTKIYFVRGSRGGNKEIWVMDYDGSNQRQITHYNTISTMPAVSPDGARVVFTSYLQGSPQVVMHSVDTGRRLHFLNQRASLNATADFTPDGKRLLYSSSASGVAQIYVADLDGGNFRRISSSNAIEVEPKVNPKNGSEVVFVSGRSGLPQIYRMNIEGADVQRLSNGEGEAVNPAWHPDGQHIAFAWTRGFSPGNYNIFVMDVASRQVVQLTHGAGRNENPSWAPDGRRIVFASTRGGSQQIWTMLADGSELRQLTTQSRNEKPVWSRR
jgi:TolB protein